MVEVHFLVRIQLRWIVQLLILQGIQQKNIVAAGVASKCLIQLSYAIGVSEPLSIYVDTYGTGSKYEKKLEDMLPKIVDLSPKGIIEKLGLRKPIYEKTAAYGHFGRAPESDGSFSWEKTDLVDDLTKNI